MQLFFLKEADVNLHNIIVPYHSDVLETKDANGRYYGHPNTAGTWVMVPEDVGDAANLMSMVNVEVKLYDDNAKSKPGDAIGDIRVFPSRLHKGIGFVADPNAKSEAHKSPIIRVGYHELWMKGLYGAEAETRLSPFHGCEHTSQSVYVPDPEGEANAYTLTHGAVYVAALVFNHTRGTYQVVLEKTSDWVEDSTLRPFGMLLDDKQPPVIIGGYTYTTLEDDTVGLQAMSVLDMAVNLTEYPKVTQEMIELSQDLWRKRRQMRLSAFANIEDILQRARNDFAKHGMAVFEFGSDSTASIEAMAEFLMGKGGKHGKH